ncbi:MAG TPA: hypothetical protein VML96_06705 [Egibacteraceae bacterium]|nr:hypothetical protein [Egibacteraceae bacterium]
MQLSQLRAAQGGAWSAGALDSRVLTPSTLVRFVVAGAFLGLGSLIFQEAVTWVAAAQSRERTLTGLTAAGPAVAVAAGLMAWHLLPPRWPVPLAAAALAAWPAYHGFTTFISDVVVPDGRPLRAVVLASLSLAALVLVTRRGEASLNWLATVLAATGLVFAVLSLYHWQSACGNEALYGGCGQDGWLEEERLLASFELPPGAQWIEAGRSVPGGGGSPGGLIAAPAAVARAGTFGAAPGVTLTGARFEDAEQERAQGRLPIAAWTAAPPRQAAGECAAFLSRIEDPRAATERISLRARAEAAKPGTSLLLLVARCG